GGNTTVWVEAIDEIKKDGAKLEWQLREGNAVIGTISTLKFVTYKSVVIGFSGETFWQHIHQDPRGNGMFDVCRRLYQNGYNVAYYDVHYVANTTGEPVNRELSQQIGNCFVTRVGLFGHSH